MLLGKNKLRKLTQHITIDNILFVYDKICDTNYANLLYTKYKD